MERVWRRWRLKWGRNGEVLREKWIVDYLDEFWIFWSFVLIWMGKGMNGMRWWGFGLDGRRDGGEREGWEGWRFERSKWMILKEFLNFFEMEGEFGRSLGDWKRFGKDWMKNGGVMGEKWVGLKSGLIGWMLSFLKFRIDMDGVENELKEMVRVWVWWELNWGRNWGRRVELKSGLFDWILIIFECFLNGEKGWWWVRWWGWGIWIWIWIEGGMGDFEDEVESWLLGWFWREI
jgi:hypothetical protein